ncbi:MAG: flavodoxin family protein [Candidatus Omnitrophota bacterium]|nr:flavodoxin family protein [Candidatus Omnitrophota bacterium]
MKSYDGVRVLGINGSPRAGGNTDIIIDKILEAVRNNGVNVDKIIINDLDLKYCQECDEPDENGNCNFKDDMSMVYKKFKEADAVILASPIFFGSISGQAKVMIDRFQCAWRAKYILKKDVFPEKKIGAFIAVSASKRRDFFENARSIVKNLFATLNIEYEEELFIPGIDEKGEILKHPDLLKKAYKLGENISKALVKGGANG